METIAYADESGNTWVFDITPKGISGLMFNAAESTATQWRDYPLEYIRARKAIQEYVNANS